MEDPELKYTSKGSAVSPLRPTERVVGRLKQDRWTSHEGQRRSKVSIVAAHVDFKPQRKGKDGDGKNGGAAEAEGKASDTQAQEERERKEAANS